nr:immunoglobulin heavy chain junction region [Macaca mulatta]MOW93092.1 immunoglobulin heavy chain junction region [Macaca mulatta]
CAYHLRRDYGLDPW